MTRQILLIEDEPNIAEAIRFLLTRDGFAVAHVANGSDALAAIVHHSPDLVILDLMLPGKSGLQILTEMRAQTAMATLPVLMLSAKGQERDREAALAAGVSAFMTKPFDNREMRDAVRVLLGAH